MKTKKVPMRKDYQAWTKVLDEFGLILSLEWWNLGQGLVGEIL